MAAGRISPTMAGLLMLLVLPGAVPAWSLGMEPVIMGRSEPILDEEKHPQIPPEINPYTGETHISPDMVDRSRYLLAGYLDQLSGRIDTFFIDTFFSEDILNDDVQGSRAKVSWYTRRKLGDPVDYKLGISLKLVFPNTNEHLNLLFQSEGEESQESNPLENAQNNNYSAALRYIIQESDRWKTNIDTGVLWAVPPDPFARFRARRYAYLDDWKFKATQTMYYFASKGWGEDSSVQMDLPLNVEKLLRLDARAGYLLNNDYFKLNYSAGLYHELSNKAVLGYIAGASGNTEKGATFNGYSLSVRYRRQIYKDWIFAEVSPELNWDSDKEYRTTPVIMFRLESVIAR